MTSGELMFVCISWALKLLSTLLPDGYGIEVNNEGITFIDYDQLNNEQSEPIDQPADHLAERLKQFIGEAK